MARNPVHHRRTKHIELDIHFVREKVAIGELHVTHIPSARQIADVFTKGLPSALFYDFRDSLSVTDATVETAGGVKADCGYYRSAVTGSLAYTTTRTTAYCTHHSNGVVCAPLKDPVLSVPSSCNLYMYTMSYQYRRSVHRIHSTGGRGGNGSGAWARAEH